MKNKIAIIGSNSFSGSSLANYLLSKNHEVIGFSRSDLPPSCYLPHHWNNLKNNFTFYKADINHHSEYISDIIKDHDIEYVADFASQGMVGPSWDSPEDWYQTNIVGKVKFHEKLRKLSKLQCYLRFSTPEVYGDTTEAIEENKIYNPSTPYAVSHAAIDMSLSAFHKRYNFPVVFTRAANVFGPGQQIYRIIPRTILYILEEKKLNLDGGGLSERSFIHIDDVSSATWNVMCKKNYGEIYHIATNELISIRNLVKLICHQMDYPFKTLVNISEDRPGKDKAYKLKCDKIYSETGWSSKISLNEGIAQTIKWVQSSYNEIKKHPYHYIHKI